MQRRALKASRTEASHPQPRWELLPAKRSSSIASARYDRARRVLRLHYTSGPVYDYSDVPPGVVAEFVEAPSRGQFVNWHIKPYYRHRRVSDGAGAL